MGARGKTSSHAVLIAGLDANKRPDPPASLTGMAAIEWRLVVGGLPANWFGPENLAMLEQRCRHVAWMQQTAELADKAAAAGDYKSYNALSRQLSSQSNLLIRLDTAMRLTQQASFDKAKRKGSSAKSGKVLPWQEAAG